MRNHSPIVICPASRKREGRSYPEIPPFTSTCHHRQPDRLDWAKIVLGVTSLLQVDLIIAIQMTLRFPSGLDPAGA